VDGYYTTFDSSEVHRIEEPSDEGGGGGLSDNMAILPKLTVTLNIDNIEHIDTYWIIGAVELNNGIITEATFNPPQTSQIWEGYIIPMITDYHLFWNAAVQLYDESYDGYYDCTISNAVNCADDPDSPRNGSIIITDPTKPASCTLNAVYTLNS
jgi:hypothetical protein